MKSDPVKNETKTKDTRFKPGNPGGPGRPKKEFCIPDILRRIGDETDPKTKKTKLEIICDMAVRQAMRGDRHAREWIANRTEGKAKEFIEQTIKKDVLEIE
jgi:hypothetical protein